MKTYRFPRLRRPDDPVARARARQQVQLAGPEPDPCREAVLEELRKIWKEVRA